MLTSEFISVHPDTPWKMIRGMRNYIVHEYFQIDDTVVWSVVKDNLSELRSQILRYIEETDWEKWGKQSIPM